jgi:hypothetical protein
MKQNSAANRAPAAMPAASVPSRPNRRMPRHWAQPSSSTVASSERIEACVSGDTEGSASLIATCCRPHSIVQASRIA